MNMHDPQTLIVGAVLLVAAIGAVVLVARERKRVQSRRLQEQFGPEYNRVVSKAGDRDKAEAELKAREARVERLQLVALPVAEATRFTEEWKLLQSRFVDNPTGVVAGADQLVRELMLKRGYPVGDFERRAADISVHHPKVVENYRAAQAIAVREARGEATTEDLRKAVVHYRELFDDLLEVNELRKPKPVVAVASARKKEVV